MEQTISKEETMQTEIVLEDCPHCGGDAKFAGLADWPYLSNIVFCPAVW